MTDETTQRIVDALTEKIGRADTFEARDEARNLVSQALDVWMKIGATRSRRRDELRPGDVFKSSHGYDLLVTEVIDTATRRDDDRHVEIRGHLHGDPSCPIRNERYSAGSTVEVYIETPPVGPGPEGELAADGRPFCTCEWEETGDAESGPSMSMVEVDANCPRHGREAQPEEWAEQERIERGYALSAIRSMLMGRENPPDVSLDEELALAFVRQAETRITPENDGHDYDRALAQAATVVYELHRQGRWPRVDGVEPDVSVEIDVAYNAPETIEDVIAELAAKGIVGKVVSYTGPAGGWPLVRLTGKRAALLEWLGADGYGLPEDEAIELVDGELPVDRPHRFTVGQRVRHTDELATAPGARVKELTWRVRNGVRYPTYVLRDLVYDEDVPDVLDTEDLIALS